MDPILDKARAGQNVLERLMNAIPGFKGYREKELRRDADRVQREHLASRLEECKKALNEVAAQLTRSGSLDLMNEVETARKRLDKVINRIRYADRGYAGFFDTIKVNEDALGRVYAFDMALVTAVERVRSGAEARLAGQMLEAIDALDASLAGREEILSGIR